MSRVEGIFLAVLILSGVISGIILFHRYTDVPIFQANISRAQKFNISSSDAMLGDASTGRVDVVPNDQTLKGGQLSFGSALPNIPMNVTVMTNSYPPSRLFTTSGANLTLVSSFETVSLSFEKPADVSFSTHAVGGTIQSIDSGNVTGPLCSGCLGLGVIPSSGFNMTFGYRGITTATGQTISTANSTVTVYSGQTQVFTATRPDGFWVIVKLPLPIDFSFTFPRPAFDSVTLTSWDSLSVTPSTLTSDFLSIVPILSSFNFPQGNITTSTKYTVLLGATKLDMKISTGDIPLRNSLAGISASVTGSADYLNVNGQDVSRPSPYGDFVANLSTVSAVLGLIGVTGFLGLFGKARGVLASGRPSLQLLITGVQANTISIHLKNAKRKWFADSRATQLAYTYAIYENVSSGKRLVDSGTEQTTDVLTPGSVSDKNIEITSALQNAESYDVSVWISCKEGASGSASFPDPKSSARR